MLAGVHLQKEQQGLISRKVILESSPSRLKLGTWRKMGKDSISPSWSSSKAVRNAPQSFQPRERERGPLVIALAIAFASHSFLVKGCHHRCWFIHVGCTCMSTRILCQRRGEMRLSLATPVQSWLPQQWLAPNVGQMQRGTPEEIQ
jgi:hypothetical protein